MTTIAANLQAVRDRIERAARAAGRSAADITLVAVSKAVPVERIAEAYAAGQQAFGESYVQEAVEKITQLAAMPLERHPPATGPLSHPLERHIASSENVNDATPDHVPRPSSGVASPLAAGPLLRPLEWHFIGPIQSNKTRAVAEHFDWVHSLARTNIALRLNDARPPHLPPINVCIQVNVSGEQSKSGVTPGDEYALARAVAALPRLRLRGLMAIPEPTADIELQRRRFALLRETRDKLAASGIVLDTLSMGMSDDLEAAIAEGATMVRVGTAIFGTRRAVKSET
jgi:PLP dependent protein